MSKLRKVVLTGANGFLGSHLVDKLLAENYEVHCVIRKTSNTQWLDNKNVHLHTCGLLDIDALSNVLKNVDFLFHLAGTVSSFDYKGYHFGNVTLTKNVFDALEKAQAKPQKIIITSSQAVTGASTTAAQATEENNAPVSFYGKSKLVQENLCHTYMDKYPITIARPCIIYGERDTEFYQFIETVKNGLVPLVGFNDKPISSIYVDDLIEGLYQMAIQDKSAGEVYHLASEEVLTWRALGEITAEILAKKPLYLSLPHFVIKAAGAISGGIGKLRKKPATFDAQKAIEGVQEGWVCSVEKAKKDLNFVAKYKAKDALAKTIDWYKKENWL